MSKMVNMSSVSAVILAGGQNSRMNYRNKAFLELEGITFIERIIRVLSKFNDIMIAAKNPLVYKHLGCRGIEDIIIGCGPMSGIHAGLTQACHDDVLVIACDMPFISHKVIQEIVDKRHGYQAAIPIMNHRIQPLSGIYNRSCLKQIEADMEQGQWKLTRFLEKVNTRYIPIHRYEKKSFENINTIMDYKNINKR